MAKLTERETFELWYVKHTAEVFVGSAVLTADAVKLLRSGERYEPSFGYLNGCWQGWQAGGAS